MSEISQNNKSDKVSALDSALELLMSFYTKTRYFLGKILIDRAMRTIVSWYDSRHSVSSQNRLGCSGERDKSLLDQTERLNRYISKLEETVSVLNSKMDNLKSQNAALSDNANHLSERNGLLDKEKERMLSQINELQQANARLLGKCLPESDLPAMIYYAQGDATGLNLRKISTTRTSQHIYRIATMPGNAAMAIFEPIVGADCRDVIENRNITLIACDIESIASNASTIVVREKGKAIFENNKWKVISKAKIILS